MGIEPETSAGAPIALPFVHLLGSASALCGTVMGAAAGVLGPIPTGVDFFFLEVSSFVLFRYYFFRGFPIKCLIPVPLEQLAVCTVIVL